VGEYDLVAGNFLVRTRQKFAAHDLMVAVVDAPSDRQQGMGPRFRVSKEHAIDIGAVAEYLKRDADVPVWLVGTGVGSWPAARGAIGAGHDGIATGLIDGVVLTSTVTRIVPGSAFANALPDIARAYPDGVMGMALSEIRVPTLIMSHSDDACEATPAADAPALAKRLTQAAKVEMLSGGDPPRSEPCEAYSQHGYYGIETQAVDRIAEFITANGRHAP
jgi:hypothetical protein